MLNSLPFFTQTMWYSSDNTQMLRSGACLVGSLHWPRRATLWRNRRRCHTPWCQMQQRWPVLHVAASTESPTKHLPNFQWLPTCGLANGGWEPSRPQIVVWFAICIAHLWTWKMTFLLFIVISRLAFTSLSLLSFCKEWRENIKSIDKLITHE